MPRYLKTQQWAQGIHPRTPGNLYWHLFNAGNLDWQSSLIGNCSSWNFSYRKILHWNFLSQENYNWKIYPLAIAKPEFSYISNSQPDLLELANKGHFVAFICSLRLPFATIIKSKGCSLQLKIVFLSQGGHYSLFCLWFQRPSNKLMISSLIIYLYAKFDHNQPINGRNTLKRPLQPFWPLIFKSKKPTASDGW